MPTQLQVIPPKHIPLPDFPPTSDLAFEFDVLVLSIFAMFGQYINLYRSVFWLPYSHTEYALVSIIEFEILRKQNIFLIDVVSIERYFLFRIGT